MTSRTTDDSQPRDDAPGAREDLDAPPQVPASGGGAGSTGERPVSTATEGGDRPRRRAAAADRPGRAALPGRPVQSRGPDPSERSASASRVKARAGRISATASAPGAARHRADLSMRRTAKPSAIVHIGLNKTGSSTIQSWLSLNRRSLRRHGVVFDVLRPDDPRGLSMVHGHYATVYADTPHWQHDQKLLRRLDVVTDADMAERVADFTRRVDGLIAAEGEALHVVSSEFLGDRLRDRTLVRAMDDWFRERFGRVEYVVYLRDQVDWVASAYAESITQGGPRSVDSFIDAYGAQDYNLLALRWAAVVGVDRFQVRLLEPDALLDGDLVSDFADLIGLDAAGTLRPGRTNEALPALRLRALRHANRLGDALARFRLGGAKARLSALTAALDTGPKLRLNDRQALRVAEMNAASNEELRAWLFPERPVLFPKSARLLAAASTPSP